MLQRHHYIIWTQLCSNEILLQFVLCKSPTKLSVPQLCVPMVQLLCPLQAHGQSDTPNTKLYIRTCPVQVHRWPNTLFIYGTTLPAPSTASSWMTISDPRKAFHLCKAIVLSVTKYLFHTHFVFNVFQHISGRFRKLLYSLVFI